MDYSRLEKGFEEAINDSSKRQYFLDMVPFGPLKSVKFVFKKSQKGSTVMKIHKRILSYVFGPKFVIFVYPLAFDKRMHENVYDFLNTLYYHEGYHALQISEGHEEMLMSKDPMMINYPELGVYWGCIVELKAHENQLININIKNSILFKSKLQKDISDLKKTVSDMKKEYGIR